MANTSLNLVDLDFTALRNSLKNYLRSQKQFSDYDYDGSNMAVLIDLLSYNSTQNAFLINMLMSEAFLDSAQLRNSVLSHAKALNYTPRSYRSSTARVRVTFEATGESAPYSIPKGSPFTTLIKNESYTFTLPELITVASANTTFTFDADIYEGFFVKDSYVFRSGVDNQRFKITNKNVDTTSLVVTVYEDGDVTGEQYQMALSLLGVGPSSKVFFLQTDVDGSYEILFGDNNIGRQPKADSVIVMEYRVAAGSVADGAREFSVDFDPTGSSELLFTPEIELLELSKNGAEAETIDSIKYYAPRHFQIQERTVNAKDYEIALKTQFPEINAVHAYGGEELTPPRFGKVYISVDLFGVDGLPESKKLEYYNFIKDRSPFSIIPVFVNPEYSYIAIRSKVRNNINTSTISKETLKSLIITKIMAYNDSYLNDFDVILRASKLSSEIDNIRSSIVSSNTDYILYKKVNPTLGVSTNIDLDFGVELVDDVPGKSSNYKSDDYTALTSSMFYYAGELCKFEDDGDGRIRIVRSNGTTTETIATVGTVDYKLGHVQIVGVNFDRYVGSAIKIYVRPKDPDIAVKHNNILTVESDEVNITVEEVRV